MTHHAITRPRRGLGLLEVLLGLFIAGLVVAAAVPLYDESAVRRGSNEMVLEMSLIQASLSRIYHDRTTYDGVNTQVLARSKLLPAKWSHDGATITNPFHGSVVVYPGSSDDGAKYYAVFNNIPVKACRYLSALDLGPNILRVEVDGSYITPDMTPGQKMSLCTDGMTNHFISWTVF
ncbi:hypothetical protein AD929_03710 [Gluconobacter potus]|uniref:Uncharacterized protein n=1 Tax=Gluconobacter potus TaxID=2724927 RepID=A0A149QYK6_9PROT|nr:type 4 pilus major pilin [Gluconobacter potus]KXV02217.1 hypothetical protein AD929_03710 [Gluconobacter potus]